MGDTQLNPEWCVVNCPSCGLGVRILVSGWIEEHRTERGAWFERFFESEEVEECVCGAIPDAPSEKELAALYDHTIGAEEPPRHGWLILDVGRRTP